MRNLRERFARIAFDKKFNGILITTVLLVAVVVVTVSVVSSALTLKKSTSEMARVQIETLANHVDTLFTSYKNMGLSLMMDHNIQDGLQSENGFQPLQISAVRSMMNASMTQQGNVNFAAIIKSMPDDYIFKGVSIVRFESSYQTDRSASIPAGVMNMRISRSRCYSDQAKYWLTVYMPIYSNTSIGRVLGELCMNFDEPLVAEEMDGADTDYNIGIVSADGQIVTGTGDIAIGGQFRLLDYLRGQSGSFQRDGHLYVYQKVGVWNFFAVGVIPMIELYKDSLYMSAMVLFMAVVIVAVGLWLGTGITKRMYGSLKSITQGMEVVSKGDFSIRLENSGESEDIAALRMGFNSMVEHINSLMERVKDEERQMERIRFNSLQAHIHPHFLYNTLDCIRWMAAAEGNTDIVRIVRALSQYYRLCLSAGRDVISIKDELEFTNNFLVIQNMRYDDAIKFVINVPEELTTIKIPKITLQPLVENFINHGFRDTDEQGIISFTGFEKKGCAVFTLADNGTGMEPDAIEKLNESLSNAQSGKSIGYGVQNVNKRIRILFGDSYGLKYYRNETGGLSVEIRLPGPENQKGYNYV